MRDDLILMLLPACAFPAYYLITKSRYIVLGFKRSGTWAKKKKWYKSNWTFLQRVFLVPLFSREDSTNQYFLLGIINYIHLIACIYVTYSLYKNGADYYTHKPFFENPFVHYVIVFYVHHFLLFKKSNESLKREKRKKIKLTTENKSNFDLEYRENTAKSIVEGEKTLEEVAKETGLSKTTISNWIRSYKKRN